MYKGRKEKERESGQVAWFWTEGIRGGEGQPGNVSSSRIMKRHPEEKGVHLHPDRSSEPL